MIIIRKIIVTICMCLSTSLSAGFLSTFGFPGFKDVTNSITKQTAQQALNVGIDCAKQNPVPACLLGLGIIGLMGEKVFCFRENYCYSELEKIQNTSNLSNCESILKNNSDPKNKKEAYEKISGEYNEVCLKLWKGSDLLNSQILNSKKDYETEITCLNQVAAFFDSEQINEAKKKIIEKSNIVESEEIQTLNKTKNSLLTCLKQAQLELEQAKKDQDAFLNQQKKLEAEKLFLAQQEKCQDQLLQTVHYCYQAKKVFGHIKMPAVIGVGTWGVLKALKYFTPELPNGVVTVVPIVATTLFGLKPFLDH